MNSFLLAIILFDIMNDRPRETRKKCYSLRCCLKNAFIFRRQKNVLPESCKNHYNAYSAQFYAISY